MRLYVCNDVRDRIPAADLLSISAQMQKTDKADDWVLLDAQIAPLCSSQ